MILDRTPMHSHNVLFNVHEFGIFQDFIEREDARTGTSFLDKPSEFSLLAMRRLKIAYELVRFLTKRIHGVGRGYL